MAGRVGHACPLPPEEAAQDATFQRLQQGALPGSGVSEQLQLDPGLDGLSWPQLLDVAQFVVVLATPKENTTEEEKDSLKTSDRSGHIEIHVYLLYDTDSQMFSFQRAPKMRRQTSIYQISFHILLLEKSSNTTVTVALAEHLVFHVRTTNNSL